MRIAGIIRESIVDGPGMRFVIFAQGCPHGCPGCHNPHTHDFEGGFDADVTSIMAEIEKNPLLRGVTFSGGEPFSQAAGFAALAKMLKADGYEVASYTGFTFEQLQNGTPEQQELLSFLDVLVDGEFILAQRNLDLRFRGSENQRILDVPKSLAAGAATWYDKERWTGTAQR